MTGGKSLPAHPHTNSLLPLLPLLLVALCFLPIAPAASAFLGSRQRLRGAAELSSRYDAVGGGWRRSREPQYHGTGVEDIARPEGGGESRTLDSDGAVDGDNSDTRTHDIYLKRDRYGNYPVTRNSEHKYHDSQVDNGRYSENTKRSSSYRPTDRSRATSSSGRGGLKDFRTGNWPQDVGAFKQTSSVGDSSREVPESIQESSITREAGEGRRLDGGNEKYSRQERGVETDKWREKVEENPSARHMEAQPRGFARNIPSETSVSTTEEIATSSGRGQGSRGAFGKPIGSVGTSEHYIPSVSPAISPVLEDQRHPMRGTIPLETPLMGIDPHGFSGSWGSDASAEELQAGLGSDAAHNRDLAMHVWEEQVPPQVQAIPIQPSQPGCDCWDTNSPEPEWECSCLDCNLTHVPTNFSDLVTHIALTNVSLQTLHNDSFTRYRDTLRDLVLENNAKLSSIKAGAFQGLYNLRSIYIHSAPKLRAMPNLTFNEDNTNLRSFRITNSGLETIPFIHYAASNNIIHMIEMDTSRIRKVHTRSLHVRVDLLSLNYNLIEEVEKEAFTGSQIAKLSLKGNTRLRNLHPEAFKGIRSLRTLDLSETSITSLPTLGLTELEVLKVERTPTLKVFPSVYSFKNIEKAHLTYPYHCCAFQFPQQHDPKRYLEAKRKMEERCSDVTSPEPLIQIPTTRPRSRPQSTTTTVHAAMVAPPSDIFHTLVPEDITSDFNDPGEHWGSLSHGADGDAVSLSSPGISNVVSIKTKRHGRSRFSENSQTPQDSHQKLYFSSPHRTWRKVATRSTVDEAFTTGITHSRTRHFGHHTRRPRLQQHFDDSQRAVGAGRTTDNLKIRFRRGSHSRHDPQLDKLPNAKDEGNMAMIPSPQHKQRLAALIREQPNEGIIPLPNKRDPHVDHHSDLLGEAFVGGNFHSAVGFGSFNNTLVRNPPSAPKSNVTYEGWKDHSWPYESPPLDSGDDDVYFGSGPGDTLHKDESGGTFHSDVFNNEPEGEVWHRTQEDSDVHSPSKWFTGQVHLPPKDTTIVIHCGNLSKDYHSVKCVPGPDAFNPCEDIMGNLWLRMAVWLVVVTAVVGNLAVMIVLISSKFKMTVSKFLMVNLALADLCMGIYLLIIAAMDLHTIGDYFNYAIDWQNGPGCKVAGFLTVFASELSIFTLTVITSERWYAITYAIHLNKRLKLSMAMKIMVGGWTYSIAMATLPLLGISSYSKTSICLPMETGDGLSLAYLVALLLVNGLAFFVITACYASMYFSISRHDATAPHSDLTVAKRMALLVFTDFACWAPIAFFGLTAVAGVPLINVTRAKILLVFFYPLNSCANPYLYAILTKQYRRDLFILLARYGFCTKRAMKYKGAYSSVNNTFPHNTVVNAPNHRNSTLTQITLCDLSRTRASQQSNNGSLLGTAAVEGSQDSLQRNVSPLRTPTKAETGTCGAAWDNERLSTVQEMSHSTHSDDEASDDHPLPGDDESHSGVMKQAGSPHPIKNCYTRLSFTPEQEEILKHALNESKAKKRRHKGEAESAEDQAAQELLGEQRKRIIENGASPGHGEAIVICEMAACRVKEEDARGRHRISGVNEEEEEEEEVVMQATSTV